MDLRAAGLKATASRRGAILVSVLWLMIFLGLLAVILRVQMVGVVAGVRVVEDKAAARTLAEAGLSLLAAEIRAGPPDGEERLGDHITFTITLPAGSASVSAANEALRIDLNTAERPLIVGALRAAGAVPAEADDLATRIIERRARPSNDRPGDPTSPQPEKKRAFQTVSELIADLGLATNIALALERYATVSSGLTGVRVEALDDRLLSAIPNLQPSVRSAIAQFRAGRLSRGQLDSVLAGVTFNTSGQAESWRFEITATVQSGYSETFKGLINVATTDQAPYRVIDWRSNTANAN